MPSSYAIGDHFENLIKNLLASGRYASASEVVRDGLRLLEAREQARAQQTERIRKEIARGVNSGSGKMAEEVFNRLIAKYEALAAVGDARKQCAS
ncbi:MAG: type II toxin-antitoxin system ParD family antitoxin [Bdellovibrionales bacterium]